MIDVEPLIRAELERRVPVPDARLADWSDVLRRAGRPGRRRLLVVAFAAMLLVALAAPAFALRDVIVDFFEAEPATERVQLQFDQMDVIAPAGMRPGIVPGSARRVMEAQLAGKLRVLSVAPTESGGFCYQWSDLWGSCATRTLPPVRGVEPGHVNALALGITYQAREDGVVEALGGTLVGIDPTRVTVEFADGDSADLRVVWVSPPIDAGFYLYDVPEAHRRAGRQVTAVVATDRDGDVLARQPFRLTPPERIAGRRTLPDGTVVQLPALALVDRARALFDFRSENGTRVKFWVMPTRDGGRCYVFNRGSNCPLPELDRPMASGLHPGSSPILFSAQLREDAVAVELRYQDGTVERLEPTEGFVLHEIGSTHYAKGRRLVAAVAVDGDGKELSRQAADPDAHGVYPCEQPIDVGRGVIACP